MRTLIRNNGLSIAMLALFAIFLAGQVVSGRADYNEERQKHGQSSIGLLDYFCTPHFLEATAENWESEFLQMGIYIIATAWLVQKGSAESNPPGKRTKVPRTVHRNSPWPVRKGGFTLRLYEHSLSSAFLILFLVAFVLHAVGAFHLVNEERLREGNAPLTLAHFMVGARFWFQSFQNWQSEFLSIAAMVLLSVFLREKNSPESKALETPNEENEV